MSEKHGSPFRWGLVALFQAFRGGAPPASRRPVETCGPEWLTRGSTERLIAAVRQAFRPECRPARHYAESMDDKARSAPAGTTSARHTGRRGDTARPAGDACTVGFAVLLLVALVRQLGTAGAGHRLARPGPWRWFSRPSTCWAPSWRNATPRRRPGSIPRPLFGACGWGPSACLWLLLIWASADFVWLAFPLFFLQLHVLPLRLALPAIALSTVLVIAALWFHNAGAAGRRPAAADGAGTGVRRGLCRGHRAGVPGAVSWKPRTSGWPPRSCAGPAPSLPAASTTPARWPSAPGWPAKSTTPWPRASPALC